MHLRHIGKVGTEFATVADGDLPVTNLCFGFLPRRRRLQQVVDRVRQLGVCYQQWIKTDQQGVIAGMEVENLSASEWSRRTCLGQRLQSAQEREHLGMS